MAADGFVVTVYLLMCERFVRCFELIGLLRTVQNRQLLLHGQCHEAGRRVAVLAEMMYVYHFCWMVPLLFQLLHL